MTEALVAGHICLDVIPEFQGRVSFEPGRLVQVGPATISTGGAVSNTGQALHRLGIKTDLRGKVGDDLFGKAICEILEKCGPGLSGGMKLSSEDATSYTVVINLSGEDRMFIHAAGCNDTFVAADVSDQAMQRARLLHFGYPTLMARMFEDDGRELEDLFSRAKKQGLTTSLDVSLPDLKGPAGKANWRNILVRVLPFTDLFLPSIDELMFMLDRDAFEERGGCDILPTKVNGLAEVALSLGAKVLGVKMGSRGIYLRTADDMSGLGRGEPSNVSDWRNQEIWGPVYEVEVAGTTGAGDATIAGLLMAWLRGMSPSDAVRAASAVGACCCERPDAVTGIQSWESTERRIQSGWPTCTSEIPEGWRLEDGLFVP